jgi:D-xylose transport system ATP-binding protein
MDVDMGADEAVDRGGSTGVPLLEAVELSKSFGAVEAVAGMSFSLQGGEILALVGDNGAGKSTTVAMLSGLLRPDKGHIRIRGEDVTIGDPRQADKLGIATVLQDLALVNQRDVAQNLYLGQELMKFGIVVDRKEMLRGAAKLVRDLGVNIPSVRTKVADLSGGQRQCVAVARAVLKGSRVILLDEPTAALGVREGRKVIDIVVKLRDAGKGIILVSHNLETVFEICDHIVVMRLGRKIADVRTSEVSREDIVGMIVGVRT